MKRLNRRYICFTKKCFGYLKPRMPQIKCGYIVFWYRKTNSRKTYFEWKKYSVNYQKKDLY